VTAIALGAAFLAVAARANASSCVIPTSSSLSVLPTGCVAVLTNGPITFTHVHETGTTDTHNVEIDSLQLFNLNAASFSAQVTFQGIDHDVTTSTNTPFNIFAQLINLETSLEGGTFAADGAPHTFDVLHFIVPVPGGTFKLNFGEAGKPDQHSLEKVTSSADTTTNPGFFTVNSFFDIFTELSLDGGFPNGTWTAADNDFNVAGGNGTGSFLQLQNQVAVPEPASLVLFGTGITAFARRRFRRQ